MECSTSNRRPRDSKRLNSNDRNATARIITALLTKYIAFPPEFKLPAANLESKARTISVRCATGSFSGGFSKVAVAIRVSLELSM
jgi:hypothetical protein